MNEKFIWIFCQHCIVFKQTNCAQTLKSLDVKVYIFVMQETSRPACDLMESFIRPRAARNTDLEWRFIVNDLEVLVWCSCIHFWTAFWDTKCYNCWDFLLRWYTIIMYQSHLNRIQYQLAQQENKKLLTMKVATWTPVSSGGHRVSADCAGRQVYGKSWMQWILAGTGRVNHDIICSIELSSLALIN